MTDKHLTPKELETLNNKMWEAAHFGMNSFFQLEALFGAMLDKVDKQQGSITEPPISQATTIQELQQLLKIGRHLCQDVGNYLDCECEDVHNARASKTYSNHQKQGS